jgi:tetratricopeptide (TPR) repeat protein
MIQAIAKQGKYKQALKMADKLIKDRDHWLERAVKGWVQREAGQYADATKTYEDVLGRVNKDKNLDPEDRELYQDQYHYILSNIYLEENQLNKATEHLQALLVRHPDDPGYNNDLGYIWADHDVKLPEAEKLILKALEMDRKRRQGAPGFKPEDDHDNGAYLDSLGWVYYKQKKFKEARDALLKAVEDKTSQHIEIYDHLGDVYMALGERDAAMKAWRKGVEVAGEGRRDRQRKAVVEKKLQMAK